MENWWEHAEEQGVGATQQAELEQFEARQKQMYHRGKILVYLIAGMNIFFSIVTVVLTGEFKPVRFLVHLLLSVGLICGVSWVRYLYIAGGILSVLVVIMAIPVLPPLGLISPVYILILVLVVLYSIVSTVVLLTSKSIKEYMYQRKNG